MEKVLQDFPVLETERLILRQIRKTDARSMLKYLSDKDVMEHYGLLPFQTEEEALDEIAWYDSIFAEKTGIRWGITIKGVDEVIGSFGFLNYVAQHSRSQIGYELDKQYWGKGIASEAIEAILEYGFGEMNLQRIEALIEPPNVASCKLVERKAFIKEGLLRSYEFNGKKFDDLYMYSLLKSDYESM
ncbi:ribosomal N-acetyltransferase YdaF [Oceanobacillus picturae]|uniref:Ribosomal N-acetyltransferase YdaF n=1 Tax=Oceanobacillus picturae TaxID=171693 RepID=W9ALT2_9BACI|nr:GNAT family protein [Oceanobacillus picturae]GAQ18270.1 ribosomal N-acetyltransferase YdaF [Oceanobacillus picturae]CDO03872.1 Putative ribosomal N-acetyltransferase YdaF [Oceanobacillus picturae]